MECPEALLGRSGATTCTVPTDSSALLRAKRPSAWMPSSFVTRMLTEFCLLD
jgi:hypothetical protein